MKKKKLLSITVSLTETRIVLLENEKKNMILL